MTFPASAPPHLLPPEGWTTEQAGALPLDPAPPPALTAALVAILSRLAKAESAPALDARDTLSTDQMIVALPPLTSRPL